MTVREPKQYKSLGTLLAGIRTMKPGQRCIYSGRASINGSMYAVREYSGVKFKTWKSDHNGARVVVVERPQE